MIMIILREKNLVHEKEKGERKAKHHTSKHLRIKFLVSLFTQLYSFYIEL